MISSRNRPMLYAAIVMMIAVSAHGQTTIDSSVIAGGGGRSTGSTFALEGTIGQAVGGGNLSGGSFGIDGGFLSTVASGQPTVTISQSVSQPDPTSQSPVNFTVVFSETVSGFVTGDVTLGGTSGATTGTVTGSGTTYNVAVSGMTTTGSIVADVPAGVATGTGSGLTNLASGGAGDHTVTFSTTPIRRVRSQITSQ